MECAASSTPSVRTQSAVISAKTSFQTTRDGLQMLLSLPQELFDLILREVPVESQIALSITCHAARQVFMSLHGNNKTWAPRRTLFVLPGNNASLLEFLHLLERDLADRYFCCRQCVMLHPFYDLATETSPAAINRRLLQGPNKGGYVQPCLMKRTSTEPLEAFATETEEEGRFSISARQLRLVEHFLRYGHGIPMSHFCREIAPASLALPLSPLLPPQLTKSTPTTTPTTTTDPVPRWRRTIEFDIQDDRNFFVRERHELVYGGSDKEAVRRFLDQTHHALCPHLVTNDPQYTPRLGPMPGLRFCRDGQLSGWDGALKSGALVRRQTWRERRRRHRGPALRCKGLRLLEVEDSGKQCRGDPVVDSRANGGWLWCNACEAAWSWGSGWDLGGGDVLGTDRVWLSVTHRTTLRRPVELVHRHPGRPVASIDRPHTSSVFRLLN